MKKTGFGALIILAALLLSGEARQSKKTEAAKQPHLERDQRLFILGAKAISNGRYDEGRILLNTMVGTYSDSSLIEEAKILVFYSYAREGGPKNEESAQLLREIQNIIERREAKNERVSGSTE